MRFSYKNGEWKTKKGIRVFHHKLKDTHTYFILKAIFSFLVSYLGMVKIVCFFGTKSQFFCLFLSKFSWFFSRFLSEKVAF
jgi:hypothetical protein